MLAQHTMSTAPTRWICPIALPHPPEAHTTISSSNSAYAIVARARARLAVHTHAWARLPCFRLPWYRGRTTDVKVFALLTSRTTRRLVPRALANANCATIHLCSGAEKTTYCFTLCRRRVNEGGGG